MANPLKQLSKLRRFDPKMDPASFLATEMRQNLSAIEDALKTLGNLNFAESVGQGEGASETAGSYADVEKLKFEMVTKGGPVLVLLVGNSIAGGTVSRAIPSAASTGYVRIMRDTQQLWQTDLSYPDTLSSAIALDRYVRAGLHTFKVQLKKASGTGINIEYMKLIGIELPMIF